MKLETAVLIAALLGCFLTVEAKAQYLTIGVGQARLNHTGDNGTWVQEGWDYVHEKKNPTYAIGLGFKLTPRIRAEIDYRDLGAFDAIVRHTTDEAYDPATHRCHGACPPTQTGFIHSDAKGVGLSATYDLIDWSFRPYVRGGLFLYTSKTVIAVLANPSDPYDHALQHFDAKRTYSATPMLGLGMCKSAFCAEYTRFFKVGGYDSPQGSADTWTLTAKVDF